jgi:hypothetical protein
MAQMGFMIVTCGLGLWAAAIIHLIAHGFYKATLFLSSGSAIARRQRDRAMPDAKQLTGRTRAAALAAAAGLPVAALSAAVLLVPVWPNDHGAELALLLFAWMTGAIATWGWLEHRPTPSGALSAAAFLLPAAIAYVTVVSAVSAFLRPAARYNDPPPDGLGDRRRGPCHVGRSSNPSGVAAQPTNTTRSLHARTQRQHHPPATRRSKPMINTTSTHVDAERTRLLSDIRVAARVVPTQYPLGTFIAVNPLAGLQAMPFEQAIRRAAELYGMRGTLPESTFRALYRQGRITDRDLDRTLTRRYPNLAGESLLRLAGRDYSATELLRMELPAGSAGPDPLRRYRIRAEDFDPAVADTVDAQSAKWCAAFLGEANWPMPGRDRGFFAAWRELAATDRTLPRGARSRLRAVAPRSDDAVLAALSTLGVADDARVVYLQAHLTRMPGWAAHVQWCSDRGTGIDLLQYLRWLTYEAALLAEQARPVNGNNSRRRHRTRSRRPPDRGVRHHARIGG